MRYEINIKRLAGDTWSFKFFQNHRLVDVMEIETVRKARVVARWAGAIRRIEWARIHEDHSTTVYLTDNIPDNGPWLDYEGFNQRFGRNPVHD